MLAFWTAPASDLKKLLTTLFATLYIYMLRLLVLMKAHKWKQVKFCEIYLTFCNKDKSFWTLDIRMK